MKRTRPSGFTLTELLVVMTIIGLLTVIVMANFQRGTRANDLRHVSTELVQRLRLAQGYAIGGNSLNYCLADTDNEYSPCENDSDCDSEPPVGSCYHGVPLGGFGVSVYGEYLYDIFANVNPTDLAYSLGDDRAILQQNNQKKGVRIASVRIGDDVFSPNVETVDVVFTVPEGKIQLFHEDTEIIDPLIVSAQFLVQSDHFSDVCRTITVNRVSGLISERQTSCGL